MTNVFFVCYNPVVENKDTNMARNKNSAAFQEFLTYKNYILEKFLEKFGKSYDNVETLRDRWFHEYAYTADREEFLVQASKLYLRIFPKTRDLKFLNALTNHMADYLSEYTMRDTEYKTKEERRAVRKAEKEALKRALYTENSYIQTLAFNQNKRGIFNTNQSDNITKHKRTRIERAKRDHIIHKQVQAEFVEVSKYKTKR